MLPASDYLFSAGTFIVPAMPIEGVGSPRVIGIAGIMNGGAQMAINHVWKTVIALFMCVLTLFAFGLKLAVEAHAFAISAGVIGLIAVILGTLGFTFATSAELQRVCSQYYNQASSEIQDAFDSAAALVVDGQIKWNDLKTIFGLGVMSLIVSSMTSYMDDGVDYQMINGVNDLVYANTFNGDGYALPLAVGSLQTVTGTRNPSSGHIRYDIGTNALGQTVYVNVSGSGQGDEFFRFYYSVVSGSTQVLSGTCDQFYKASSSVYQSFAFDMNILKVAPCKMVVSGVEYLSIVFAMLGSDGVRRYFGSGDAVTGFNLTDFGTTTTTDWYGQVGAIDDGIIGQAWDVALDQDYDDTDVITLTDSLPWAASQTSDVIDVGYTQSDVLTDVGINDIVQDITSEIDMDYPLSIDDYKVPPAWVNPSDGKTIRFADIFPFCIPFDIYDFLSLLSATRTAPHFEIPFNYDRIGLDYTFVFDLSGESWENLAQIVRTLELLAFCVGLAFVTRDMIKG